MGKPKIDESSSVAFATSDVGQQIMQLPLHKCCTCLPSLQPSTPVNVVRSLRCSLQTLGNIAWAYAMLGVDGLKVLDRMADHAVTVQEPLDFQTVSTIFWSYATLGILHGELIGHLGSLINMEEELEHAGAQG